MKMKFNQMVKVVSSKKLIEFVRDTVPQLARMAESDEVHLGSRYRTKLILFYDVMTSYIEAVQGSRPNFIYDDNHPVITDFKKHIKNFSLNVTEVIDTIESPLLVEAQSEEAKTKVILKPLIDMVQVELLRLRFNPTDYVGGDVSSVNRISAVEMRKNLETVEMLKQIGLDFVVIPCRNEAHKNELLINAKECLEAITEEIEFRETKISPLEI
jgi:hypothetical protein